MSGLSQKQHVTKILGYLGEGPASVGRLLNEILVDVQNIVSCFEAISKSVEFEW